jgi:hypothetical protein
MSAENFGMGDPIQARNYEEFLAVMRAWLSAWERPLRIEAEEFINRRSDPRPGPLEWPWRGAAWRSRAGAHLWTFRDGLAVRLDTYRDRDEARAAMEGAQP